MNADEIMNRIIRCCKEQCADTVILFGSRAKGTDTQRSDFDIAVSGAVDFESLREELDAIPTLYKIDLINIDTCKNQLLLEDIKQYGRKVYQKI